MRERRPPDRQCPRHVRQIHRRMARQIRVQLRRLRRQRARRLRRPHQQLRARRRCARRARRRFFQHHMRVGPAQPERTHPGAPRARARRPRLRRRRHVERALPQLHVRRRRLEPNQRRHDPVVQRQRRLDQPRHSRRPIQMPDVRLHRPHRAEPDLRRCPPKRLDHRRQFHRVPQLRPGPMPLDVADRLRVDTGIRQRPHQHRHLTAQARRRVADFPQPVVVHRRPANHRVDLVPRRHRLRQPPQYHHPDAAAHHRPLRPRVVAAALPVRRQDPAFLIRVADAVRHAQDDAAGQREAAFVRQQALAREVDGDERRRAERLHREARSAQIQLVRNRRGQRIGLVVHRDLEMSGRLDDVCARPDVIQRVR